VRIPIALLLLGIGATCAVSGQDRTTTTCTTYVPNQINCRSTTWSAPDPNATHPLPGANALAEYFSAKQQAQQEEAKREEIRADAGRFKEQLEAQREILSRQAAQFREQADIERQRFELEKQRSDLEALKDQLLVLEQQRLIEQAAAERAAEHATVKSRQRKQSAPVPSEDLTPSQRRELAQQK
jgi:hypothetical protein